MAVVAPDRLAILKFDTVRINPRPADNVTKSPFPCAWCQQPSVAIIDRKCLAPPVRYVDYACDTHVAAWAPYSSTGAPALCDVCGQASHGPGSMCIKARPENPVPLEETIAKLAAEQAPPKTERGNANVDEHIFSPEPANKRICAICGQGNRNRAHVKSAAPATSVAIPAQLPLGTAEYPCAACSTPEQPKTDHVGENCPKGRPHQFTGITDQPCQYCGAPFMVERHRPPETSSEYGKFWAQMEEREKPVKLAEEGRKSIERQRGDPPTDFTPAISKETFVTTGHCYSRGWVGQTEFYRDQRAGEVECPSCKVAGKISTEPMPEPELGTPPPYIPDHLPEAPAGPAPQEMGPDANWGWWTVLQRQQEWIDNQRAAVPFPDVDTVGREYTGMDGLRAKLQQFGGARTHLNALYGQQEGICIALSETFKSAMSAAKAMAEMDMRKAKLPETRITEAAKEQHVYADPDIGEQMRATRRRSIEAEALLATIKGMLKAYDAAWETISRQMTGEQAEMELERSGRTN
jgi:hypothetical protein